MTFVVDNKNIEYHEPYLLETLNNYLLLQLMGSNMSTLFFYCQFWLFHLRDICNSDFEIGIVEPTQFNI